MISAQVIWNAYFMSVVTNTQKITTTNVSKEKSNDYVKNGSKMVMAAAIIGSLDAYMLRRCCGVR